ncbi:MAG: periplasmic heavy metal sensor [Acidobacteriia bacterium]|nr:periplasmic heavy metal sensor [Terriglobia bacterium]
MDFFKPPVVVAAFLCCGIAVGQDVTYIANPGAGNATSGSDPGYGYHSALQELINLTDEQREQLSSINHALEDALFPITLEAFQKYWELGRAFRTEPPDEATVTMIAADFERIQARIAGVTEEHRKMARAILSWPQLIVLGSLEAALQQYPAAQEAAQLNLIAEPDIFGIAEPDVFGPGGFIPFDGGIALFPEGRGAARGQPVTETTLDAVRLSQGLARLLARQKIGEQSVKGPR